MRRVVHTINAARRYKAEKARGHSGKAVLGQLGCTPARAVKAVHTIDLPTTAQFAGRAEFGTPRRPSTDLPEGTQVATNFATNAHVHK